MSLSPSLSLFHPTTVHNFKKLNRWLIGSRYWINGWTSGSLIDLGHPVFIFKNKIFINIYDLTCFLLWAWPDSGPMVIDLITNPIGFIKLHQVCMVDPIGNLFDQSFGSRSNKSNQPVSQILKHSSSFNCYYCHHHHSTTVVAVTISLHHRCYYHSHPTTSVIIIIL